MEYEDLREIFTSIALSFECASGSTIQFVPWKDRKSATPEQLAASQRAFENRSRMAWAIKDVVREVVEAAERSRMFPVPPGWAAVIRWNDSGEYAAYPVVASGADFDAADVWVMTGGPEPGLVKLEKFAGESVVVREDELLAAGLDYRSGHRSLGDWIAENEEIDALQQGAKQ